MENRLKIQRAIREVNQLDIFLKTGISQSRLSLIERGYAIPKDEEKQRLAKFLKCKIADIFPENGGGNRD